MPEPPGAYQCGPCTNPCLGAIDHRLPLNEGRNAMLNDALASAWSTCPHDANAKSLPFLVPSRPHRRALLARVCWIDIGDRHPEQLGLVLYHLSAIDRTTNCATRAWTTWTGVRSFVCRSAVPFLFRSLAERLVDYFS